jgi:hypothetical protein
MLGIFVLVSAVILTLHRIQRRRRMALPRGAAQVVPPP